jgi:hypothetical protein
MADQANNQIGDALRSEYGKRADVISTPTPAEILHAKNLGTTGDVINRTARESSIGSIDSAISDNIFGINHRQIPSAIQINKDFYGLTFFTRPQLNLSTDNVRMVRHLVPLLSTDPKSYSRYIRCSLDPSLAAKRNITSPLVDSQQAFIPLLTNNLLSISGWPDVTVQTYTSPAGTYEEVYGMVDSVSDIYSAYDLTATFRNLPGDPITAMFLYWTHYESLVFQGVIYPYPEHIINRTMDYSTRIWRLVLDSTKTFVQKIACTGGSFPVSSPIGASFDFTSDRPINNQNDQITIPFKCFGACYQDDILIQEFNATVTDANDGMSDAQRERYYVEIPFEALTLLNGEGYPRINPSNYKLQWWIEKSRWNALFPDIKPYLNNQTK